MEQQVYFWAKTTPDGEPGCTVWEHGMAAAEVARLLLELLPEAFRKRLPKGLLPLIALHDIGKISPGFQTKCPKWKGPDGRADELTLKEWGKFNGKHAEISKWILEQYFKTIHRDDKTHSWAGWAQCAGAHHGRYALNLTSFSQPIPSSWRGYLAELIKRAVETFGELPKEPMEDDVSAFQEWVIGLTEVADWIASNGDYFPPEGGLTAEQTAEAARKALRLIGFVPDSSVKPGRSWAELFPHAPTPRPMQLHLWEHAPVPGVYIVEDAMGGGKTEAAFGLAYHLMEAGVANGLYFALPTQTTSNRIFSRMLDFLANAGAEVDAHSVRLAHGNSWLVQDDIFDGWRETARAQGRHAPDGNDDAAPCLARNWFASARRALLTRFGVGTIDQALMGEINVKHSFVRRYALSGKVVILDEVHSYDMYTGTLLTNLVRNLRTVGATVIILSATLTQERLHELLVSPGAAAQGYPLCSIAVEGAESVEEKTFAAVERSVKVSCQSLDVAAAIELACERAQSGQCVLWIRNTVKEAQEAYKLLCSERCEGGPELGLLHARFPLWRRQELEESWIGRLGRDGSSRPRGCVLVATQVAEQSLDIDADFLITDLAPTDMLLQRAGRLWRHERPLSARHAEAAEMLVLTPDAPDDADKADLKSALGLSGYVYAPYVLLRTREVWRGVSTLRLPADIRRLLESTYEKRPEEGDTAMGEFKDELKKRKSIMEDSAMLSMMKGDNRKDDTTATTRYDSSPTLDLLLLAEKPTPLTGNRTLYKPLKGEPFVVDSQCWDFHTARAIQENLVHYPCSWGVEIQLKSQLDQNPCIKNYGFSTVYPIFPLDPDAPFVYNAGMGWTPELGVYLNRTTNSAAYEDD